MALNFLIMQNERVLITILEQAVKASGPVAHDSSGFAEVIVWGKQSDSLFHWNEDTDDQ